MAVSAQFHTLRLRICVEPDFDALETETEQQLLRSYDPKLLQLGRHDLSKAQIYLWEAFDHQASAKTST